MPSSNLHSIYLLLYHPVLRKLFNIVLSQTIKWFAPNNLILNLDKTNIMKFITKKNSSHSTLQIGYKEKYIEETENTKFLGLQIDNQINYKDHIEQTTPK
jgi:membrane-bound lytic murein transglycosylase MltF